MHGRCAHLIAARDPWRRCGTGIIGSAGCATESACSARAGHSPVCGREARAFFDWIVRAVAGDPAQVQIMYGVRGERRYLTGVELEWLDGYEGAKPVPRGAAPPAASANSTSSGGQTPALVISVRQVDASTPTVLMPWVRSAGVRRIMLPTACAAAGPAASGRCGSGVRLPHRKVSAWTAAGSGNPHVEDHGLDKPVDDLREDFVEGHLRRGGAVRDSTPSSTPSRSTTAARGRTRAFCSYR